MDEDVAIAPEQVTAPPVPSRAPARRGPRTRIAILIAILLAVLYAALPIGAVLVLRESGTERAQQEVLDVSRRFVALLTTYNATTIDAQRGRVLALSTGRFRGEYETLTGSSFVTTLKERQAESKGSVVRIAVSDVEGENATVLAVVRVTTTNKDLKTPRVDNNLLEVSLVETAAGWRIDAVTILGTLG